MRVDRLQLQRWGKSVALLGVGLWTVGKVLVRAQENSRELLRLHEDQNPDHADKSDENGAGSP